MKLKTLPALLGLTMTIGGVAATWHYAGATITTIPSSKVDLGLSGFIYTPEEMPEEEVTVVGRLYNILNNKYEHEGLVNDKNQSITSRLYLLEETILVTWGDANEPYVGSMDKNYAREIGVLFEDVLFDTNVSFLLKSEDLNNDGYNEIAMYSTSDTLDNTSGEYNGVVCVYVTVYTPIVKNGQVTSYELVTESIRGYCSEIYYSSGNRVGSFSTDTWCDSVALYNLSRWNGRETFNRELKENEKLNYSVYNNPKNGNNDTSVTRPYGKSLSTVLKNEF